LGGEAVKRLTYYTILALAGFACGLLLYLLTHLP
jgi:hypothetical protein